MCMCECVVSVCECVCVHVCMGAGVTFGCTYRMYIRVVSHFRVCVRMCPRPYTVFRSFKCPFKGMHACGDLILRS